jgi:hypothetical protein
MTALLLDAGDLLPAEVRERDGWGWPVKCPGPIQPLAVSPVSPVMAQTDAGYVYQRLLDPVPVQFGIQSKSLWAHWICWAAVLTAVNNPGGV